MILFLMGSTKVPTDVCVGSRLLREVGETVNGVFVVLAEAVKTEK